MAHENLNIDLLRCFATVVEHQSFTRAAKELMRTQSAVSNQIKKLESALGKTLLVRQKKSVFPTEHGEILLGYAGRILQINDETVQRFLNSDIQGKIRLGIVEYLAPQHLPFILAKLRSSYPRLDIGIKIDLSGALIRDLDDNRLDIVLVADHQARGQGEVIFKEKLCWATGVREDPDPEGPLPLALIPAPCFFRQAAIEALDKAGREWKIQVDAMNVSGVQTVLRAGLAIGVLGKSSLAPGLRQLGPDSQFPVLPSFGYTILARHERFSDFKSLLVAFFREQSLDLL